MPVLRTLVILTFALLPACAMAIPPGEDGFMAVRHCVMENDPNLCHAALTSSSYPLFDRFASYKLMPCLPTNFTYVGEKPLGDHTLVKATMPGGGGKMYIINLLFTPGPDGRMKLDIPESLHRGMGENWQNKIQLSEQLYLMMKQNMGDKLTCDNLNALIEIKK